jgi:hypothetical protein
MLPWNWYKAMTQNAQFGNKLKMGCTCAANTSASINVFYSLPNHEDGLDVQLWRANEVGSFKSLVQQLKTHVPKLKPLHFYFQVKDSETNQIVKDEESWKRLF